jgi:fatty acid desaturase
MQLFEAGHYWVILFSGMLAHAFFIVVVHDGAHKSITRGKMDRIIMNIGSGLMLMPFYAEPFRKFHLIHHSNTNTDVDPLWPDTKKNLYDNHRFFYLMCTMIPLLFTLYLIVTQQRKVKKMNRVVMSPRMNFYHIAWSSLISATIIYLARPSLAFVLCTLLVLNMFSVLRHWCEHLGYNNEHESNTFWFPMGMGIGNHDVHHHIPHLSWFTLWLGLWKRPKTTSVFRAIYGVLFDKKFEHYMAEPHNHG